MLRMSGREENMKTQKVKTRVVDWCAQLFTFSPFPQTYYNPQFYDPQSKKWRPYTKAFNGIIKPILYQSRAEAEEYARKMRLKDKRSKD